MSLKKKPQQFRSATLVSAIQSSVVQVLESIGLEQLTVGQVANRSGVSVGSIYQYFAGRDSLVASALENHAIQLFSQIEAVIESTDSRGLTAKDLVGRVVDSVLDVVLGNVERATKVYSLTAKLGLLPVMMRFRESVRRTAVQKIKPFLRDDLSPMKIEVGSYLIVNCIAGLVTAKAHGYASPGDFSQTKAEVKELIWNYISPYVKAGQ